MSIDELYRRKLIFKVIKKEFAHNYRNTIRNIVERYRKQQVSEKLFHWEMSLILKNEHPIIKFFHLHYQETICGGIFDPLKKRIIDAIIDIFLNNHETFHLSSALTETNHRAAKPNFRHTILHNNSCVIRWTMPFFFLVRGAFYLTIQSSTKS